MLSRRERDPHNHSLAVADSSMSLELMPRLLLMVADVLDPSKKEDTHREAMRQETSWFRKGWFQMLERERRSTGAGLFDKEAW